jgi:hypothetical protein
MPDTPPSPTALTRTRIFILILGALAVTLIIGAISGGVGNYQQLRDARDAALSSSEAARSSAPN